MSTPLTVAWKYRSFHVCGVEKMSRSFAQSAEEKEEEV